MPLIRTRFVVAAAIAVAGLSVLAYAQVEVATPASSAPPAKTLVLTNPAPALTGLTWLKGEPVRAFEPGRVYVVEFWATWCGPCRASIPHLTALQARHKDRVTVIGVSAFERPREASGRVEIAREFVEQQGAAMEYAVAADAEGVAARAWMEAAGRRGIPSAFIIDGAGKVAWVGSPLRGMDAVLEKVLAGGFDPVAQGDREARAAIEQQKKSELFARAMLLDQQGKPAEGLALVEEYLTLETERAVRAPIYRHKLRLQLKVDEAAAHAFARDLLEGELRENGSALHSLAEVLVRAEGLKSPDHDLAVELAERAVAASEPVNHVVRDTLSRARFAAGDVDGAIAAAEEAVRILEAVAGRAGGGDLRRISLRIEEYKRAKGEE